MADRRDEASETDAAMLAVEVVVVSGWWVRRRGAAVPVPAVARLSPADIGTADADADADVFVVVVEVEVVRCVDCTSGGRCVDCTSGGR
jgi:hypothetical protein